MSFSSVIRKQVELYVSKRTAKDTEAIHIVSFSKSNNLFKVFSAEVKKRTKRITATANIGNSVYNIDGNNLVSKNYADIQRILNNIAKTSAFKKEAGDTFDLKTYTSHEILLNIQKNVPLSLIGKLKNSDDMEFVEYSATNDTNVNTKNAKSRFTLKTSGSTVDTKNLTKFFTDYIYTSGKALINKMASTVSDVFLLGKAKTYKKKERTSGKIKKKTSKINVIPHNPIKLRDLKGKFTSTIKLMNLLQPRMTKYIKRNMDTAAYFKTLNNRFTETTKIESITQMSDKLYIQYDYLNNYNDFRVGKRLYRPGREPETVIDSSIRLAAAKVINKKFKIITQRKSYI